MCANQSPFQCFSKYKLASAEIFFERKTTKNKFSKWQTLSNFLI